MRSLQIFSGENYAAAYYSYLWAEILAADIFRTFVDSKFQFNRDLAEKLKEHIYSANPSDDLEKCYIAFRGRAPSANALIEEKNL